MNGGGLENVIDQILFFVSQWAGVTLPRIVSALTGLLIIVLTAMARWERRLKIAPSILLVLVGGILVAIAADTRILHFMVDTSYLDRIRFLLALLSVLVMAITFESIRISRLRERYALLWMATAGLIFLASLFPDIIHFLTALLGVQYVTAVVVVLFTFLLLVVFHFSIALSGLEEDRAKIAQRCGLLELRLEQVEARLDLNQPPAVVPKTTLVKQPAQPELQQRRPTRLLRGAEAAALAIIVLAFFATLFVGFKTSSPLIGDEVTHYFMLKNQAASWPVPSFRAEIPNAWGDAPEVRHYPHPNGWHYVGGMIDRFLGGSFYLTQVYQGLFWLQLLVVAFFWSRARGGDHNRSMLLYIIVLASVPMNLLFSVSFYQDVPMAAQAVTAFYLLDRRRYLWAAVFMALAIWIKVTGIIFALPFFVVGMCRLWKDGREGVMRWGRAWIALGLMATLVAGMMLANSWMLKRYVGSPYYPVQQIERVLEKILQVGVQAIPVAPREVVEVDEEERPVTSYEVEIIAHHPGDLRKPVNFVLFGGVLIWLVLAGAVVGLIRPRSEKIQPGASRRQSWPLLVGLFYIAITYFQLRTAPDARFFLPALPFIALPLCEWCMRLPWTRLILIGASVTGLMQGAHVLKKAGDLRQVTPGIEEAITYLKENPPVPNRVFMYPEGNYRLFPSPHDWYLGYRLRELWTGDNDFRIELLRGKGIGAVVVKKHLVGELDPEMHDLGVYPTGFVKDLLRDERFELVMENDAVMIFDLLDDAGGSD